MVFVTATKGGSKKAAGERGASECEADKAVSLSLWQFIRIVIHSFAPLNLNDYLIQYDSSCSLH